MEKLLHWSIVNAQEDKEAIAKVGQPDPKLLQQLFGGGGPDDPTLMREAMAVVRNEEAELENRLVAMDNFEMLIENLDNANNIENMKLWTPLLETLSDSEENLRAAALSVIGTAAQNNEPTQNAFSKQEEGLMKIIQLANDTKEPLNVRCKAFYALSNLIKNHTVLATEFLKSHGLDIIAPVLSDPSSKPKLKTRAVSLLNAFLSSVEITEGLISTLREDGVVEAAICCLRSDSEVSIVDRVLNFLSQLITAGIKFTEEEVSELSLGMKNIEGLKEKLNEDDFSTVKYVL